MNQKISIGIPTFNSEKTIVRTVQSLKEQSHKNWECIISDNNSSDRTIELVKQLITNDERFKLIINEENLGPNKNWNQLLYFSTNKYFLLLCSDDILYNNALADLTNAITQSENIVLSFGRRNIINSNYKLILKYKVKSTFPTIINKDDCIKKILKSGGNPFSEPSFVLINREKLIDAGGYSQKWRFPIDLDSYLKRNNRNRGSIFNAK